MINEKSAALYVIARPIFDRDAFRQFLTDENQTWLEGDNSTDAEKLIEAAGRICYMSFGQRQFRRGSSYIANLIARGHESVLEHASWSFLLCGVSRAFTHQLVRHRIGFSYSQLSQQYHDETEASFVAPRSVVRSPELRRVWTNAVESAKQAYSALLETELSFRSTELSKETRQEAMRLVRSAARSVLPNATETKIFFTANARSLRHFLTIRGAVEGDEEMRIVSALLLRELQPDAPTIFADFRIEELEDGTPIVKKCSCRET
jgi:thymidylate synthase (FAD)